MAGGDLIVKHLWIQDESGGQGDPANVSESSPVYPGLVGKIGFIKDSTGLVPKILQYVKRVSTDTTVAAAAYNLAYWQDVDDFVVCADQTLALGGSTAPLAAGVFLGTNPQAGSYGYIRVGGQVVDLDQAGTDATNVAAGDPLYVAGGDSDGKVTSVAVGTDATTIAAEILVRKRQVAGYALEAETDSTVTLSVFLTLPRNGW